MTHKIWDDTDIAIPARMKEGRVVADAIVAATTNTIGIKEKGSDSMDRTNRVFELTLRAGDGRERRELAWFPTEAVRQDFYDKARRNGLTVTINK